MDHSWEEPPQLDMIRCYHCQAYNLWPLMSRGTTSGKIENYPSVAMKIFEMIYYYLNEAVALLVRLVVWLTAHQNRSCFAKKTTTSSTFFDLSLSNERQLA